MWTTETYASVCAWFAERDPVVARLLHETGFVDAPPRRSLYAWLLGAVVGQRISFKAARTLRGRLYDALGGDDFERSDVDALARDGLTGPAHLAEAARLGKRVAAAVDHLHAWMDDQDLATLRLDDLASVAANVNGIGPWTVQTAAICFIMSGAAGDDADVDCLLASDLIVRRGLKHLYELDDEPRAGSDVVDTLTALWSPYATYVTYYLWKVSS